MKDIYRKRCEEFFAKLPEGYNASVDWHPDMDECSILIHHMATDTSFKITRTGVPTPIFFKVALETVERHQQLAAHQNADNSDNGKDQSQG